MRLEPDKIVGSFMVTSWFFGCDSNGEPYGVAVAYADGPWNPGVSYSYREFWL